MRRQTTEWGSIRVGGRAYRYDGDDNLGNSIFTALEPFHIFEIVEKSCGNNLFIRLEIYPMKNGHFYVQPYIQSGASSSDCYTRHFFKFAGEFETRESAMKLEQLWIGIPVPVAACMELGQASIRWRVRRRRAHLMPFMRRPQNVLAEFGLTRVWAFRRYPVNSNTPPVPDRVAFLPGNNVGRIFV